MLDEGKSISQLARDLDLTASAFGEKPRHRGTLLGGALFGIGWSMTGVCPGPILVDLCRPAPHAGGR